jgi:hypothetical protein|uniref:Cache domain-containing protein n=1 Tax=Desulfobacca acetoxidans TaxID=60893 RepID=A0A7C5AMK1_9BACT
MKRTAIREKGFFLILLIFFAGWRAWGCSESLPLSPRQAGFRDQVFRVLERLADPLAQPVAQEDKRGIQGVLLRLFSVCADDCEGLLDNVVVLDRDGVTIAVYPEEKVPMWNFSDYAAVKRAVESKTPVPAILYRPDGTAISAICAPLLHKERVEGVVVLVIESRKLKEKLGLTETEFLSLDFSRS